MSINRPIKPSTTGAKSRSPRKPRPQPVIFLGPKVPALDRAANIGPLLVEVREIRHRRSQGGDGSGSAGDQLLGVHWASNLLIALA